MAAFLWKNEGLLMLLMRGCWRSQNKGGGGGVWLGAFAGKRCGLPQRCAWQQVFPNVKPPSLTRKPIMGEGGFGRHLFGNKCGLPQRCVWPQVSPNVKPSILNLKPIMQAALSADKDAYGNTSPRT